MKQITNKQFDRLVERAIRYLTPKAKALMKECPVLVLNRCEGLEHQPSWGVLGTFSGTPRNSHGLMPPKIELYREDICFANRLSSNKTIIVHIAHIIAHELCHYLGADERDAELFNINLTKLGVKNEKDSSNRRQGFFRRTFGGLFGRKR